MSAPAAVVAVPLLCGVVAGAWSESGSHAGLAVLAAAWIAAVIGLWSARGALVIAGTIAGSFAAGLVLGCDASHDAMNPSLLTWYRDSGSPDAPVHLTGRLREDAAATASGLTAIVDVTSGPRRSLDGGVRVTVAGMRAGELRQRWRAGRTVAMDVVLHEPLDYRDPGVPSDRLRLARAGIVLIGSIKSAALTATLARGTWLSEAAAALRAWVRRGVTAAVGRWSPRSAGVVTAILIGDRSGLQAEDERRLQEAGTYHVIAISGGNVALLTALLVWLGRAARFPGRWVAAASIALLAFYGYAAGLAPSVLRATLAGVVYLLSRALDHRGAAINALAVAAAAAAAAAPLSVLDAGFVLSFGATLGIVTMASRLTFAPRRSRDVSRMRALARQAIYAAAALCAATVCAEIALAPIGARLFGRVSLAGLPLNFVAIPLMSIIQIAGLAAVVAGAVSGALAGGCGWIAHVGTVALIRSAALVDVAPWLVLDLPPPARWVIALWYAGWAALLLSRARLVRTVAGGAVAIGLVLLVVAPAATRAVRIAPPPTGWTRIVFLDVGQGDATLLWPAGARPILIDAGGAPGTAIDIGRRVTLPASWAFGVRTLAALVLTHGDPDHIGGAPAILRALSPSEIWDGVPVPGHEPLQRLRALAARARVPWIGRRAGESLTMGVAVLRVLNPPAPDWERQKVRNDDSIVLEVRVGDVAIVLPGDITKAIEPEVAQFIEAAPTVIVKAPHHGSAGSSSPAFVDAAQPAAVIFSAGRRNPFGHPAPAIVERYRLAGAQVFSTAEDGAVVVETDGKQVTIWTWTGRRIRLPARTP